MIATIHIDHLLRDAVRTPYPMLVTRPTGAAIRTRIQAALAESDCETALLDFSAIELIDLSCADEVVVKLLATDTMARRYVVLRGLCADQRDAVEHVLRQQGLAVAALVPAAADLAPDLTPDLAPAADRPALLGRASDELRAAFHAACAARGPIDVSALARALGWEEARARTALETLAAHRVLRAAADGYHPLPTLPTV